MPSLYAGLAAVGTLGRRIVGAFVGAPPVPSASTTFSRELPPQLSKPAEPSPAEPSCSEEQLARLEQIASERREKYELVRKHLPLWAAGSPWYRDDQPSDFVTQMVGAVGNRDAYAVKATTEEILRGVSTTLPEWLHREDNRSFYSGLSDHFGSIDGELRQVFDTPTERAFYASLGDKIEFVRRMESALSGIMRGTPPTERDDRAASLVRELRTEPRSPYGEDSSPRAPLECLRLNYSNIYERWLDRTPEERAALLQEESAAKQKVRDIRRGYEQTSKTLREAHTALTALYHSWNAPGPRPWQDGPPPDDLRAKVAALPSPGLGSQVLEPNHHELFEGRFRRELVNVRRELRSEAFMYSQLHHNLGQRLQRFDDPEKTRARSLGR